MGRLQICFCAVVIRYIKNLIANIRPAPKLSEVFISFKTKRQLDAIITRQTLNSVDAIRQAEAWVERNMHEHSRRDLTLDYRSSQDEELLFGQFKCVSDMELRHLLAHTFKTLGTAATPLW